MSKELEALEHIGDCYVKSEGKDLWISDNYGDDYDIVYSALERLEAIDNAKPSEALEKYLKWLERQEFFIELSDKTYVKCIDIIKPALQKAQEQEKLLKEVKANLTIELNNKKNAIEMFKEERTLRENQEKVLEIIFEKNVDVRWLKEIDNVDTYNATKGFYRDDLTEEEFELLKRYFK